MNNSSVTAIVAGKVSPFNGQCVILLPEKWLKKGKTVEQEKIMG